MQNDVTEEPAFWLLHHENETQFLAHIGVFFHQPPDLQLADTDMTISCNTVPQKFYLSEVLCEESQNLATLALGVHFWFWSPLVLPTVNTTWCM